MEVFYLVSCVIAYYQGHIPGERFLFAQTHSTPAVVCMLILSTCAEHTKDDHLAKYLTFTCMYSFDTECDVDNDIDSGTFWAVTLQEVSAYQAQPFPQTLSVEWKTSLPERKYSEYACTEYLYLVGNISS